MLDPEKIDFEITDRKAKSFFELSPEIICGIEKSVAKICAYLRFFVLCDKPVSDSNLGQTKH
jgi:hypothetical protein